MNDRLQILCGDVTERLRELPAGSVHCCVCSPPYWGLRDYGTAQWEGGDEGCDHIEPQGGSDPVNSAKQLTSYGTRLIQYRDVCGKCGAKRIDSQLGLEKTPDEYVARMVAVFREVRRVLRKDGTLWLNLGDSYARSPARGVKFQAKLNGEGATYLHNQQAVEGNRGPEIPPGLKEKDLCGIPWRVGFALQADGWWLRSDIIWAKPNPMPESVTDRPTKSHEYLFLLTKSANYFYDAAAIKEPSEDVLGTDRFKGRGGISREDYEPNTQGWNGTGLKHTYRDYSSGRNKRSVWTVATAPFSDWTETVRWKRVEAGARGDGTRRIVSPNSQVDGGLFDLIATVLYDEHGEKSLTDICGICNRLSLEPRDGYVPSEKLRAYCFGDENLDSFLRRRLGSAIRRNNGTSKTGLFVATTLACKPSVERSCRIGRILEIHGWSEQDRDMLLSNTWPDDWPVHLWGKTLYHIGGNAACEGMYRKASEMQSHFATYPPDLIKPCILAGTSAKGCCAKCGSPWERVVEGGLTAHDGETNSIYEKGSAANRLALLRQAARQRGGEYQSGTKTTSWQPTCGCDALKNSIVRYGDTIPCIVLDPFAGSGTTGAVALELGRKAILIELNQKYVELIKRRCDVTPGLALA